jgi:FHA domain/Domain of unknown function (DUF1707)
VRPSDREREARAQLLRDHSVEGRLSLETFSRRLERTYTARSRAELDELVRDLPPGGRLTRACTAIAARASALVASVEAAWRTPRATRLPLPAHSPDTTLIIGRDQRCDCVLADASVSRRHAELTQRSGSWVLRDLGSLNGTRLNGWRVITPVEVRPGDHVTFGGVDVRLSEP